VEYFFPSHCASPYEVNLLLLTYPFYLPFEKTQNTHTHTHTHKIRFHATVLLGNGVRRLHKAHATVDDVLFDGDVTKKAIDDGQVVIVATVQWSQPQIDSVAAQIEVCVCGLVFVMLSRTSDYMAMYLSFSLFQVKY
jgi:hypothetical protein